MITFSAIRTPSVLAGTEGPLYSHHTSISGDAYISVRFFDTVTAFKLLPTGCPSTTFSSILTSCKAVVLAWRFSECTDHPRQMLGEP